MRIGQFHPRYGAMHFCCDLDLVMIRIVVEVRFFIVQQNEVVLFFFLLNIVNDGTYIRIKLEIRDKLERPNEKSFQYEENMFYSVMTER